MGFAAFWLRSSPRSSQISVCPASLPACVLQKYRLNIKLPADQQESAGRGSRRRRLSRSKSEPTDRLAASLWGLGKSKVAASLPRKSGVALCGWPQPW